LVFAACAEVIRDCRNNGCGEKSNLRSNMNVNPEKEIVDTWNINNRINLYMLDAIPPEALNDASASKGRTVAQQFAHLHNVRLMWLSVSGPEFIKGIEKVEKDAASDKKLLTRSLKESGKAMEALFKKAVA